MISYYNGGQRSLDHTTTLQDELTGSLIGLVRATKGNEDLITASTDSLIQEGLSATAASTDSHDDILQDLLLRVAAEKKRIVLDCACRAALLGHTDEEVDRFFYQALFVSGFDHWNAQQYLSFVQELGQVHLKCVALPEQTAVP